ncbi:MAG TPA: HD domain-containing phosphohydrolase [bacterium]
MRDDFSEIVKNITGALKGMNYYSPAHPAVLQQIDRCIQLLRPILFEKNSLVMTVVDSVLVVGGEPFQYANQSVDEFIKRLKDRKVEGLQIKQGISPDEFNRFIQILNEDPEKLKEFGGVEFALAKRGIVNIVTRKIEELDEEKEIETRAKKVYGDARNAVLEIMREARIGNFQKATKVIRIVTDMSEIMLKDQSALIGLSMIQDYDEYTFNHSVNVGILSLVLGNTLKLVGKDLIDLGLAGLLHDVGKTETPKNIILKPTRLTSEEWDIMKQHPVHGYNIASKMEGINKVTAQIIYEHHVKHDLSGYPSITTKPYSLTNIVSIADCYDSMTTLRPYQKRFDPKEALDIMTKMVNKAFNPEYFKVFIKVLGIYPIGSLVRLDTNEIALVTRINPDDTTMPVVRIIFDATGKPLKDVFEVNLGESDSKTGRRKRTIVSTVNPATQALVDLNKYFK